MSFLKFHEQGNSPKFNKINRAFLEFFTRLSLEIIIIILLAIDRGWRDSAIGLLLFYGSKVGKLPVKCDDNELI